MQVKKREGESSGSLIYRFSKKTQQSGIIKEAKKRRFNQRAVSRLSRKLSAIHRVRKRKEYEYKKKMGFL